MRQLPRCEHCFRVRPCRLAESCIECEQGSSRLCSRLIRQIQKQMLGLRIVVAEWNIGAVAAAGFRVACCAGLVAPPSFPSVAANTRDDGRTEAALITSRSAITTLLSITLRTLGISLCLLTSTLGRIRLSAFAQAQTCCLVLR